MPNSVWRRDGQGRGQGAPGRRGLSPQISAVGPGFFDTVGIPAARRPRLHARRTSSARRKVAIVNEAFARYFFAGRTRSAARFGFARDDGQRHRDRRRREGREGQQPARRGPALRLHRRCRSRTGVAGTAFYVRTAMPEAGVVAAVRQACAASTPQLPVYDLKTMEAQIGESLFAERMVAALSAAFGLLATLLAAVGPLRRDELQRRAPHARDRHPPRARRAAASACCGWCCARWAMLAGLGLGLGLPARGRPGAPAARRSSSACAPYDPLTLASATPLLAAVTLLAGLVPARRAMRVDPDARAAVRVGGPLGPDRVGPALRRTDARQEPRLHRRRRPDARPRHRRQHRDLHADRPGAAPPAAGRGRRSELVLLDGPGTFSGAHRVNDHTVLVPDVPRAARPDSEAFSGVIARYPSDATLGWRGRTERVQVEARHRELLRRARRPARARPGLHARRRPHAGRAPAGDADARLLVAPLRVRPGHRRADARAQRPAR